MTKGTKPLRNIVLAGAASLAGLTGCKSTAEYTPAQLSSLLEDNEISYKDSLKFKRTNATLKERAETLEGEERQALDTLTSEYSKVIAEFDGNVKYTLLPVAELSTLEGPQNLNFTKFFKTVSYTGTAQEIADLVGAETWEELLPKVRGEFESTKGKEALANLYAVRQDWSKKAVEKIPALAKLQASEAEKIKSNTMGYRLVIAGQVPVSEELRGQLSFTQVPAEEETTEEVVAKEE